MPDIYSPIQNEEMQPVTRVPVPLSRYLSTAFEAGQSDSVLEHLNRIGEDHAGNVDTSPVLTVDDANKKYGVGSLKFHDPVKETVAQAMSQRERNRMDQELILYNGGDNLAKKAGAFGLQILGATANPVDFSSMFVPYVGEAGKAEALMRAGKPLAAAFARGLITREAIERAIPSAPRLAESMVQGTLWQGTFGEIPRIVQAHMESQPVDWTGVGGDLIGQAAFAGALHGAASILKRMIPKNREELSRTAMNQWLSDEDIRVDDMIPMDQHIIEYQAIERDRVAREEAANKIDQEAIKKQVVDKYGEYPIDAALRNRQTGEIRTGPAHPLIDGYENSSESSGESGHNPDAEWLRGFVTDKGRFVTRKEADQMTGSGGDFLTSEALHSETSDPDWLSHTEREKFDMLREQGMTDAEAITEIRKDRLQRREQRILSNPDVQRDIRELQEKAIAEYIDNKKKQLQNPQKKQVEKTIHDDEIRKHTGSMDQLAKSLEDEKLQKTQTETSGEKPIEDSIHSAIDSAVDCILAKLK